MEYNLITNIEGCYIDVPRLLYYSHIPTGIIALLMGIFVFWKSRNFEQTAIGNKVYISNERLANLVEGRVKTWHCKMAIGML